MSTTTRPQPVRALTRPEQAGEVGAAISVLVRAGTSREAAARAVRQAFAAGIGAALHVVSEALPHDDARWLAEQISERAS